MRNKNTWLAIGLTLVIVIAGGAIVRFLRRPASKLTAAGRQQVEALQSLVAEKTAALVGQRGQIVAVSFQNGMPGERLWLEAFGQALKAYPQLTLTATEQVSANRLAAAGDSASGGAALYQELLQKHAGADAVVFFFGPPWGEIKGLAARPDQRPACVVVQSNPQQLKALLQAKLVQLAFVPPILPSSNRNDPRWQVLTADNAAELPDF